MTEKQLAPAVEAKVAAYRPKGVVEHGWDAVADMVRERVRATGPASPEVARRLLGAASRLAVWAGGEHLPLVESVVFSDETIERYVSGLAVGDASRATVRSLLRRVRLDHATPATSVTSAIGYTGVRPPYTPEELAGLWRLAGAQPTDLRRRRLQALICLSAGAGCSSSDLRTITAESVTDDPEGPTVVVIGGDRPRAVPVLAGFDRALVELAAESSERLLVGASPTSRNLVCRLIDSISGGQDLPRLDVARLRSTWLVCLIGARLPLDYIVGVAGLQSMRSLGDLVAYTHLYTAEAEPDLLAATARQAWRPAWL